MKPKEGTGNIYMCVFFRFGRSSRWMNKVNQSNRERNEILPLLLVMHYRLSSFPRTEIEKLLKEQGEQLKAEFQAQFLPLVMCRGWHTIP